MIAGNSPIMNNAHGTLGRTVYVRRYYDKTVVCNWPRKPDKSKETELQKINRQAFREASFYAKIALRKDPELKAYYQRKAKKLQLPNAYTAAVTDYMRKGKIESVDRKKYTGKAGGEIVVVARKKDFAVREVCVSLSAATGELIEQGLAVKNKDGDWIYRNTVAVRDAGSVVLKVRGADTDGRGMDYNFENVIGDRLALNFKL